MTWTGGWSVYRTHWRMNGTGGLPHVILPWGDRADTLLDIATDRFKGA